MLKLINKQYMNNHDFIFQNASKKLRTMGDLNSITHFGSIDALTAAGDVSTYISMHVVGDS